MTDNKTRATSMRTLNQEELTTVSGGIVPWPLLAGLIIMVAKGLANGNHKNPNDR